MSSSVLYGSSTETQIQSNFAAGTFVYGTNSSGNSVLTGITNNIAQYLHYSFYGNPYRIVYTGRKRYSGSYVYVYNTGSLSIPIASLGESNQDNFGAAMDAYVGYPYTQLRYTWNRNQPPYGYYNSNGRRISDETYAFNSYDFVDVYRTDITTNSSSNPSYKKPCYKDLITGYSLDNKLKVLETIQIVPTSTKTVTIEYYRANPHESIPGLTSIDIAHYTVDLVKGKPDYLPIKNPVMGTLWISDSAVESLVRQVNLPSGSYPISSYFPSGVSELFSEWQALHATATASLSPLTGTGNLITESNTSYVSSTVRILGANNDVWNNNYQINDVDFDINHPMFSIDNQRAYDWHIKPQTDGSYGNLIMDSPRTIEIHAALNAGKWGINPDDPSTPRMDDLGWRIQRTNEILGIRVGTDGKFDPEIEKKIVRQVIPSNAQVDAEKVGVNNFGSGGRIVKRINNRFDKDGIKSDQCVLVHDLMQLLEEHHDQNNLAFGIQESSAIEIKNPNDKEGKDRARFDNQLGLLLEMFNLLSSANEMTRSNLISSLITQSQTSELIAGLGLPSVTKTIPIKIDKKVNQVPYKGIAGHRSLSQEVATCTANVGIVLGQLL